MNFGFIEGYIYYVTISQMSGLFGLLGTIIKTGFQATVLTIGGMGGFTYLTKPKDETFSEDVSKTLPIGTQIGGKAIISGGTTIKDYVFIKIAEPPSGILSSKYYMGIVNQWVPLKENINIKSFKCNLSLFSNKRE